MRHFRDGYLAKSDEGKKMIQEYYEIAPSIVEKIRKEENGKEIFSDIFDDIRQTVSLIKIGDLENAATHYKEMVSIVKQKFDKNQRGKGGEKYGTPN